MRRGFNIQDTLNLSIGMVVIIHCFTFLKPSTGIALITYFISNGLVLFPSPHHNSLGLYAPWSPQELSREQFAVDGTVRSQRIHCKYNAGNDST